MSLLAFCFNSLQTGKRIQSHQSYSHPPDRYKFQFPFKRGKRIQRTFRYFQAIGKEKVSIPFKRESVSKDKGMFCSGRRSWFQFPSNGKAYPKSPYKFFRQLHLNLFQFPSNGKAYPKKTGSRGTKISGESFNSLQTGKRIQSLVLDMAQGIKGEFQFPSNGKAYPKEVPLQQFAGYRVSIPFKRESVSKVTKTSLKFNLHLLFQFPSNGKAYPKEEYKFSIAGGA